jgi:hypothetical protein
MGRVTTMALHVLPFLPRTSLVATRPLFVSTLHPPLFFAARPRAPLAPLAAAHARFLGAAPPTPRQPLRFEIWDYIKDPSGATVLQTIEGGGKRGWDKEFDKDAAASIKRPDVEKKLEELFYPTPSPASASYVLIMGEHGTGKSTAVRRVIRDRRGVNGAIYVNVPTDLTKFGEVVSQAVGFPTDTVDTGDLLRRLNATTKKERKPDPSREPMAVWSVVSDCIVKEAAITFKKKHGRPIALIIDSVELIAEKKPEFLADLQTFAKKMTDDGILRVVFVCSGGGSVLKQLDSENASSRSLDPFEVGDICDEDAIEFLTGNGVEKTQAAEAVRDITGGRFALLQRYLGSWAAKGNEATRADLFKKTKNSLRLAGLDPRHPFFRALALQQRVDDDPARDLLGMEHQSILRTILEKNIVAAHPDLTYTFHSRYVDTFFKGVFAAVGREGSGAETGEHGT